MTLWVGAVVITAVAIAAALPAVLRFVRLLRAAPELFETHGAANDPRF
jgi:hypothetical protein